MLAGALSFASRFFSRRTLFADRFLYSTPAALGLEARAVEFPAAGGVTLRGHHLPGKEAGLVVFCAGNSANVSCHLEYVRLVARGGFSVLAFDYRGFGRSGGEPDLRRVADDIEGAIRFGRQFGGRSGSAGGVPVGLFGISLGGNAALSVAARGQASVDAVAVEGVADVTAMLAGFWGRGSFGPSRIGLVGHPDGRLWPRTQARLGRGGLPAPGARLLAGAAALCYPFPGKSLAPLARGLEETPVFIIHGVEDQLLPVEAAIELHGRLKGPKRLWLIPATGHAQEPALTAGAEYAAQLADFFTLAFARRRLEEPTVALGALEGAAARGWERPVGLEVRAGGNGAGPLLVTLLGGGQLRQLHLPGNGMATVELPGAEASATAVRLLSGGEDPVAAGYRAGGYQGAYRRLVRAINERRLPELDAALEESFRLERRYPFDFLAAVYSLRAAQAGLGLVPGWRGRDPAIARRSLERFLKLWEAHPFLPGPDVPASPAAWARHRLAEAGA